MLLGGARRIPRLKRGDIDQTMGENKDYYVLRSIKDHLGRVSSPSSSSLTFLFLFRKGLEIPREAMTKRVCPSVFFSCFFQKYLGCLEESQVTQATTTMTRARVTGEMLLISI